MTKALLASAAALALMGVSFDANALALGAISVQSALGSPLRAEIEIPEMSSEEAASLHASIASRKEFQAAGVGYSASLADAQVSLQHRTNGQPYLRVVGRSPVNEPFVNLVINANWASGHIRRDYTVLINPPGRAASAVTKASQPAAEKTPNQRTPTASTPTVAEQVTPPAVQRPRPNPKAPRARTREETVTPDHNKKVSVKRGDTASEIAVASGLRNASLDQMLIAMLRANPKAFIRNNVNLVKAGAVVRIPTTQQARAVSRGEASRLVLAQTRDFHAYRQRLAGQVETTAPKSVAAAQSAQGEVQPAHVEDKQAPAQSPDQLTISKATTGDKAATQEAQSRQETEQSQRVAELNRNITELSQLQKAAKTGDAATTANGQSGNAATQTSEASGTAPAVAAAAATAGASQGTTGANDAATTANSSADKASAPDASASQAQAEPGANAPAAQATTPTQATESTAKPATAKPDAKPAGIAVKAKSPVPAPAAPTTWWDDLLGNSRSLGLGAGLIILLIAYGLYASRRRKNARTIGAFTTTAGAGGDDHADREPIVDAGKSPAKDDLKTDATDAKQLGKPDSKETPTPSPVGEEQVSTAPSPLDLNLELGDLDAPAAPTPAPAEADESIDFQPTTLAAQPPAAESPGAEEAKEQPPITQDEPSSAEPATTAMSFAPPPAPATTAENDTHEDDDDGMIDFDVSALTSEAKAAAEPAAAAAAHESADDPLITKLSLAQEFNNIGDKEGARSLAQEVIASASGELKQRAEKFLAEL